MSKINWRLEAPLLFGIFLDLAGFGMIIPDIQTRAEKLGADGTRIGLLLAVYFAIQTIMSPRWGRLSDRVGRKKILLVCGALSTLSMLVYGLANSVAVITLARVLAGFGAANTAVGSAYLANAVGPEGRRAAMGRIGATIAAGLTLGPFLGGQLAHFGGNRAVGFVAAGLSAIGLGWMAIALDDEKPAQAEESEEHRSAKPKRVKLIGRYPRVLPVLLLSAASVFALACLEGTFGRLIARTLGYGEREFGLIFGYEAALGFMVQSVLVAKLGNRVSARTILFASMLMSGIGLGMTPYAPNLAVLFLASTIYGIGWGVASPSINTIASQLVPDEHQGELFGLLQGSRSVSFMLGPVLGGRLFDLRPDAPYLLAGGVAFLSGVASLVLIRKEPTPATVN